MDSHDAAVPPSHIDGEHKTNRNASDNGSHAK